VTSCPQCKKTFEKAAGIPVKDIAEIVCEGMQKSEALHKIGQRQENRSGTKIKSRMLASN
jgi:hypothetical protein